MSKYIDLVLVRTEKFGQMVYACPAFTHLTEGDRVVVEGVTQPELDGVVVASMTTREEGEEEEFFLKATNTQMPLRRVLKKVWFTEMDWKAEDEDDTVRIDG